MKSLATDRSGNSICDEHNIQNSAPDYDDYADYRDWIIDLYDRIQDLGINTGSVCSISMRIGKKHFLVTPDLFSDSRRELTPEMIVRVRTTDLKYRGNVRPSVESGIHAECYLKRPKVRFVIHTHQMYATCMGILGYRVLSTDFRGEHINIPCASYAIPESKRAAANLGEVLEKYGNSMYISDAYVLANHGIVCMGHDDAAVINTMCNIEEAASQFLNIRCSLKIPENRIQGCGSRKISGEIVYTDPGVSDRLKRYHMDIYSKRPDINFIFHDKSEAVMSLSRRLRKLDPLLDDTARIIGKNIIIPYNDHGKDGYDIRVGKKSSVIFLRDEGALCLGRTQEEAELIENVMDCEAVAQVVSARFGSYSGLSYYDACRTADAYKRNVASHC